MAKLVAFYSRADENYFGGSMKYIQIGNTEKAAKMIADMTTVQRLTGSSLMLAALIEERHDYVDTASFSSDCSNDTLQVLIMIVR